MSSALPDLSPALQGLSSALQGLRSALPGLLSALPDLLSAVRGLWLALPHAPRYTQNSLRRSKKFSNHYNTSHSTPVPVIRHPSCFTGRPEYPPRVQYSPKIDALKFLLHILSDTPVGCHRLKYLLLMILRPIYAVARTSEDLSLISVYCCMF